jgi:serine/threonine-protein kinase HipA
MSGTKPMLTIYLDKEAVATLTYDHEKLQWQYFPNWQEVGFALSPHLSLNNNIPTTNIVNFLRNLLPEGYGFDELVQNFQISKNNTFGLIRALGQDMPGAMIAIPSDQRPPKNSSFRPINGDELEQRLNHRDEMSLIIWDKKPRLSSAGIQDKINVLLTPENEMGFAEGNLGSTHILKFERKGQSHLVLNEYMTMQLAKDCGLNTANTTLIRIGKHLALLVERFDRKFISMKKVKRRHLIDGCQALNLRPEYKYERIFGDGRDVAHIRDGASLPKLFSFANQCTNPAKTVFRLLDWALFNIYNSDAHGKNLSFFVGPKGIELAPFYDLVNIKMFENFSHKMAMAFGDEFELDNIGADELVDFADSCDLKFSLVLKQLKFISSQLIQALDKFPHDIVLNEEENKYALKYKGMILERCKQLLGRPD